MERPAGGCFGVLKTTTVVAGEVGACLLRGCKSNRSGLVFVSGLETLSPYLVG